MRRPTFRETASGIGVVTAVAGLWGCGSASSPNTTTSGGESGTAPATASPFPSSRPKVITTPKVRSSEGALSVKPCDDAASYAGTITCLVVKIEGMWQAAPKSERLTKGLTGDAVGFQVPLKGMPGVTIQMTADKAANAISVTEQTSTGLAVSFIAGNNPGGEDVPGGDTVAPDTSCLYGVGTNMAQRATETLLNTYVYGPGANIVTGTTTAESIASGNVNGAYLLLLSAQGAGPAALPGAYNTATNGCEPATNN